MPGNGLRRAKDLLISDKELVKSWRKGWRLIILIVYLSRSMKWMLCFLSIISGIGKASTCCQCNSVHRFNWRYFSFLPDLQDIGGRRQGPLMVSFHLLGYFSQTVQTLFSDCSILNIWNCHLPGQTSSTPPCSYLRSKSKQRTEQVSAAVTPLTIRWRRCVAAAAVPDALRVNDSI